MHARIKDLLAKSPSHNSGGRIVLRSLCLAKAFKRDESRSNALAQLSTSRRRSKTEPCSVVAECKHDVEPLAVNNALLRFQPEAFT